MKVFIEAWRCWRENSMEQHAAAIAFYAVLSAAPLVLLGLALVSALPFAAEESLLRTAERFGEGVGTQILRALLELLQDARNGLTTTVLGTVVLLFFSAKVFRQIRFSLNTILGHETKAWLADRLYALLMVIAFVALLVPLFLSGLLLSALRVFVSELVGSALAQVTSLLVTVLLLVGFFALIFRYVPNKRPPWRAVWLGAAITAVLFALGNIVMGLLLGQSLLLNIYSAAGALVLLLLWAYYSAQLLLYGAEVVRSARELGAR